MRERNRAKTLGKIFRVLSTVFLPTHRVDVGRDRMTCFNVNISLGKSISILAVSIADCKSD